MKKKLVNKKSASKYLSTALKRSDEKEFLERLRKVVDANGGMTRLSEDTSLSRGTLYKTISEDGNPKIETVIRILGALDMDLCIVAK